MNTERYGEIKDIKNDNDLQAAKCSIAVLDEVLSNHFIFDNIVIEVIPNDYSVAITLDIPSEFYYESMLDGKKEDFNYSHLENLCILAKTYSNLEKTGLIKDAHNERDRLRILVHDYISRNIKQDV